MFKIQHQYFSDRADACAEIQANKLHMMEFEVPGVSNDVHWHRFDATLYMLAGKLHITDGATGEIHEVGVGDKVLLPQGTLHAEQSDGYTVLLGSSIAPDQFDDPVDIPAKVKP